jgi:2-aminoadipate transaminase
LQKRYARKAQIMGEALIQRFPEMVKWLEPQGGLYFWARLPKRCKTGSKSKVFQSALRAKVLYVPGALCYADDPARQKPDHEMRLSFGSATDSALAEGLHRLGKAIHQALG